MASEEMLLVIFERNNAFRRICPLLYPEENLNIYLRKYAIAWPYMYLIRGIQPLVSSKKTDSKHLDGWRHGEGIRDCRGEGSSELLDVRGSFSFLSRMKAIYRTSSRILLDERIGWHVVGRVVEESSVFQRARLEKTSYWTGGFRHGRGFSSESDGKGSGVGKVWRL